MPLSPTLFRGPPLNANHVTRPILGRAAGCARAAKRGVITCMSTTYEHGRYWHDGVQCAHWHWDCECGGRSRGGDIQSDAESNAMQHRLRNSVGHPDPRVYQEGCP
jgi:hypothetical protein